MTNNPENNSITNKDYCPYKNYFGKNDKKICMGQIRHIIAQGLVTAMAPKLTYCADSIDKMQLNNNVTSQL